jgi:hypothetical protein
LEASESSEVRSVVYVLALGEIAVGDDEESVNGEGGVEWPPLPSKWDVSEAGTGVKLARAASMKPVDE